MASITMRLEEKLPTWMHRLTHWRSMATALAMGLDAMIQGAWDLAFAAMPGQSAYGPEYGGFPNIDALQYLGRDRRLTRGPLESPEAFAARCRRYTDWWRSSGTAFAILEQLAAVSSGAPAARARLVTSAGLWYTREPEGTFRLHTPDGTGFTYNPATGETAANTAQAHPWDWDSQTNPSADPRRFWLILYGPIPGLIPDHEHTWGDLDSWWGDGGLWGLDTTEAYIESLRAVLAEWRCAGIDVPWIIVAFDPASFDPETPGPYPAAGLPDGWWGQPWRPDPGDPTHAIESRLDTARYVVADPGGTPLVIPPE